jgi:hypothetical protein
VTAARDGRFARFMKWVGVAAALLSFATALYGVLHAEGDLRERRRVVAEQLATGRQHQAAGDYAAAWESFRIASTTAEVDGLAAKLLGGLSAERRRVRTAREDLAMEWVRNAHAAEGQTFADVAGPVVEVLASGAAAASGVRKSDLLAHLGWAYFLKYRSGAFGVKPDVPYREALAADAMNPYANVFWGHWILWNHGSMREAGERFAAALSTQRARTDVRRFELAALSNTRSDEYRAAWLGAVIDMREHAEPLTPDIWAELYSLCYAMLDDEGLRRTIFAAVPPPRLVALQRELLKSGAIDESQQLVTKAVTAITLEAASQSDEALAAWRALLGEVSRYPDADLSARARAAIERLSVAAAPGR